MQRTSGLDLFTSELNPDALRDVVAWGDRRNPTWIGPDGASLLAKLQSHTERKAFFDSWAEAMLARHLLARDCELRFEVPTPHDRRADFQVSRGSEMFFLHLKRLDSDRPPHRKLVVSSRLRVLERITRPYIVQVRWHEGANDDDMLSLIQQAEGFILQAHVGDEMRAMGEDGREIGGVRIIAPNVGGAEHVSVTIGLPSGFIDLSPRMHRLLNRAHEQFMPKSDNVIVIASNHVDDVLDFESALLGSHIERWDQFPPHGQRVAHGRAQDGFWHGRKFADSHFAVWMKFEPRSATIKSRLYVRRGVDVDGGVRRALESLFDRGD